MASDAVLPELTGPEKKGRSGVLPWLGAMLLLTILAGAAGGFLGLRLLPTVKPNSDSAGKPEMALPDGKYAGDSKLRELPPIITNLADPPDAWIRLQASVVFNGKESGMPDTMAAQVSQDLLGFLKTLSIAQIGGASGLQHLREDLNERAQIRSAGAVRELIIETLVVQ